MKSKREKDIAKIKAHRDLLKEQRRGKQNIERKEATLEEKPTILIVCEGKNTEPSYFKQFKLSSATVKAIGEGYNTVSLVKRTEQLAKIKDYDQVWCVFDKDDFNDTDFNNAILMSEGLDFNTAYSNQAFEYWLILHFNDHQGAGMLRSDYDDVINGLLESLPSTVVYDGKRSKLIEEDFFNLLVGIDTKTNNRRVDLAIKRAERNYNQHDHLNPASEQSTTTVFKLVRELLKYV